MSIKVLRTKLENLDERKKKGNRKFDTQDYVFVETRDDLRQMEPEERMSGISDFAINQGCHAYKASQKRWGSYWLRDASVGYQSLYNLDDFLCSYTTETYFPYRVSFFDSYENKVDNADAYSNFLGVRPCLAIDVNSLISAQGDQQRVKIEEIKKGGEILYRTIEIPDFQYPQSKISDEESKKLEEAYNSQNLKKTGRSYTGRDISKEQDEGSKIYDEYSYEDSLYVRVDAKPNWYEYEYSDGTNVCDNEIIWIKVEPIKWIIKNWEQLPREINPEGTGETDRIQLKSKDILIGGMCMYHTKNTDADVYIDLTDNRFYGGFSDMCEVLDPICETKMDIERSSIKNVRMGLPINVSAATKVMWQNSKVRAYLNGYNLQKEIEQGNGNKKYLAEHNYDFAGRGFLNEMDHSAQMYFEAQNDDKLQTQKTKPSDFVPDEPEMTL